MSKIITLDGLRDYLTNLKRLFVTKTDAESTYATKAENNTKANNSAVVHKSGDETVAGTKTFSKPIVGSVTGSSGSCTGNAATATTAATAQACTGNAATATKLATARTINGTAFNGTANITTANWGTARDITIADSTGDNTGEAVSVNGSAAVTLKLPATIKASLDGNAATATSATTAASATTATTAKACTGNAATATKLAAKRTIALSGAATGTATGFDGSGNITIPVTSLDASKLTGTASVSTTGNAATATQFSANATVALTGDATGTSAGSKKGWSVPVTLANSGVTAGTYGPSADVTGNNNATISVPEITVDAKGRVTSVVNRTLTCKNNTYTVNNATLTIQKNGTNVATFTSNASSNATANITVPTKVSELTNDSGFLTSHQSLSNYVTLNGAQTISGAKTFTGDIIGIIKNDSTEDANSLYSTTAGSKLTYYTTSNGSTRLTNVPDAINTTLESRTIRRLSDSDWNVEQICHNSNGLYYRKGANGTWGAWKTFAFTDSNISGNAATATKLAAKRTIALSGAATGTATSFDGSGNITIPVTSLDASKLTGTASVGTTGNAATATTATTAKACTGNAATATKLATARTINGTAFNGTANITTANWGTARNISIADATATNTGEAVSVNGSAAVTLKLPAAIKANVTGSLTGNAATATKLAAKRTIALSGAATGTATGFDGSGNITIPVTALSPSAIRAQWYAAYPDGPEAHNAMWGGRDITAAFNNGTVSANIANGTFRDIFPGDYITKQVTISGKTYTVNWVVADCDYWWHKGDQNNGMETHHVVIVPQVSIFEANMNARDTTEGGYAGSRMYKNVIPACATGIVSAFGADHILTFRDGITNSVDTSHVSSGLPQWTGTPGWGGTWVSVQCNLMSEKMVYGAPICAAGAMDNSIATRQMSAFRLSEKLINYNRQAWWLRDVVSSANFARVFGAGGAGASGASDVRGVRPFALLV